MEKIKIVVNGCEGKMGKAILACVSNYPGIEVLGTTDIGGNIRGILTLNRPRVVVVDFSSHAGTPALAELCSEWFVPLVIGTTGHTDDELVSLKGEASRIIPIVMATNFSTGVNALFWLARRAAEILGPGFDLEIVEVHHRLKKDAPSGTAKTLAEILQKVRIQQTERTKEAVPLKYGRQGMGGRLIDEIGIHSIRGGDVVGDHTVIFAGIGERVELTHKASSRDTFARGALRAVEWAVGKPPGLYSMMDVLGFK